MTEQEGCIKIIHHHTRTIVVYNHNKVSVTHMLVSGNKKSIRTSVCVTPHTQTSHTSCKNWNEENSPTYSSKMIGLEPMTSHAIFSDDVIGVLQSHHISQFQALGIGVCRSHHKQGK